MSRQTRDEIRLSEKHGVNPSMSVCFWCGEDDGTILLLGKINRTIRGVSDPEAPRRMVASREPCADCQAKMVLGVTFIEVDIVEGNEPSMDNATGRWWVLREEAVDRMGLDPTLNETIRKAGCTMIDKKVVEILGFDRFEETTESKEESKT